MAEDRKEMTDIELLEHASKKHLAEVTAPSVAEPQAACLGLVQRMSAEDYAATEKRVKRKLDMRMMTSLVLIYLLNYLDRNNIAASKIAGIEDDLHLTSTQFSTAVSLLFVGYILMQVPSNIFLARLRPSIYLPACMAAWGTISTCTGAVQSAGGLYAARFMLGFVEACYYPGSIFLISSWYTRHEMGLRCAILYAGSQIGSAFSGLIAAGITEGLNGARGLLAWRWIFIIEGSITVTVALLSFLVLPDFPNNTRWLSPEESAVAQWRLALDAERLDEEPTDWITGFRAAFRDWRMYVFAGMFMCVMVTTSTQNFFPAVVNTLGFDQVNTLLLTAPPYLCSAAFSIVNNWSADRHRNSSFHVMAPMAIAIVGFVVGAASSDTGARYFAMFLMIIGGHGSNAVTIAWASKTMIRPRVKRAAMVAFVNAFGNCAQIYASYFYPQQDAPRYVLAMSVNSGFAVAGILLAILMRLVLLRANRKIAQAADVDAVAVTSPAADGTEHPGGRSWDHSYEAAAAGFKYIA